MLGLKGGCFLFLLFYFFEVESHCVAQASLKLSSPSCLSLAHAEITGLICKYITARAWLLLGVVAQACDPALRS